MNGNNRSRLLAAIMSIGMVLGISFEASASVIDYNKPVSGSVGSWSIDTWTFDASEGDSIELRLSDVKGRWFWFTFPTKVEVTLLDSNNAVVASARCGSGSCLEVDDLAAGEHLVEISYKGLYAEYDMELVTGFCLEVWDEISWPYPTESSPDHAFAYGAANYSTYAEAQAGAIEIEGADYEITAGSCQSLVADCQDAASSPVCAKDPDSDDEEERFEFENLCELKNSVKARALGSDAPPEQTAALFYLDEQC